MKKLFTIFALSAVLLSGCGFSKTVDVDLTPEQIAAYEADVAKWDELINTPVVCEEEVVVDEESEPETEESVFEIETSNEGSLEYEIVEKCDTRPDIDYFVEKARALDSLGRVGDAIDVYDDAFEFYDNSSVAWHNLGRLYEEIGEYEKAIENYQKLIDTFRLTQYNRDIAWAYVYAGDAESAEQAYILFVNDFGGNDDGLKQKIEELKN